MAMSYDDRARRRPSEDAARSELFGREDGGFRRTSQSAYRPQYVPDYDDDVDVERQRAEVAELMQRTEGVRDETLETTRNLVRITAETERIGVETSMELDRQNESLDRTNQNLDSIDSHTRQAERHLTNMEKFLGLFTMPWNRQSNIERTAAYKAAYKSSPPSESRKGDDAAQRRQSNDDRAGLFGSAPPARANGGRTSEGELPSYKRGLTEAQAQKESEIDSNIDAVGDSVQRLKALALGLGDKIDASNAKIDTITAKTEVSGIRVQKAKDRAANLMK